MSGSEAVPRFGAGWRGDPVLTEETIADLKGPTKIIGQVAGRQLEGVATGAEGRGLSSQHPVVDDAQINVSVTVSTGWDG